MKANYLSAEVDLAEGRLSETQKQRISGRGVIFLIEGEKYLPLRWFESYALVRKYADFGSPVLSPPFLCFIVGYRISLAMTGSRDF